MENPDKLTRKFEEMERKIARLENRVANLQKQGILIAGDFDGTTIPITVKGVRRGISTTTP